jgi:hypothetical protein
MPLEEVAFVVCTALDNAGVTAVLTGGSAATIYAPEAYQSRDLDFVLDWLGGDGGGIALASLGYEVHQGSYRHLQNPYTIDFPRGPLAVGNEEIEAWKTLRKGELLLHIISPADSVRDRLAAYFHWRDEIGFQTAVAVARAQKVDVKRIEPWMRSEGTADKCDRFLRACAGK